MKNFQYTLTIIIPTYNSSRYIVKNLKKFMKLLKLNFTKYNIIVVDDKSADNTIALIRKNFKSIDLICNKTNSGKGFCIRKALKFSKKSKYYIFIDDDLPYLKYFKLFCKNVLSSKYDLVVAQRQNKINDINLNIRVREVFSRLINLITRKIFLIPYRDTQAGLKGFNNLYANNFKKIITNRFLFDLELFLITIKKDARIKTIFVNSEKKNYSLSLIYSLSVYISVVNDLVTIYKKYIKN
mgnify:FL=1|jgi:glycosyltransferase involved in cell wall biosynthesis|tara:strand:- start:10029 stop:10748 length:720 start_codon:yes stop_codon:yes gene_type:complete